MVTTHIARLEKLRAQVAHEEKQIATMMRAELRALPGRYGFQTSVQLFRAIEDAYHPVNGGGPRKAKKSKPRGRHAALTAEEKKKIIDLCKKGKGPSEIAKITGRSTAIINVLKRRWKAAKKTQKHGPISAEEKNEIGILFSQGLTDVQIAKKLKHSTATIWNVKKELGLIKKPRLH
jgi:DNA-binding CsgD family transcriptional regulator